MYAYGVCDRCPWKVLKVVTDDQGCDRFIRVRCNAVAGHTGCCHWNLGIATRGEPTDIERY
jgi:hypothetical protein